MLTLFFIFLSAAHAQLQNQLVPAPGRFEVLGEFDYLNTTANFPAGGGSSTSLLGGGKYSKMEGRGQVSFDVNDQLRVYAGLSGGQATANVIDLANSNTTFVTDTQTSTGMNEVWAGGQWWYPTGDLDLVPQFDFVYPIWRADPNATNTLLGDGALRLQAGGMIRYNFDNFIPFAYLGYAYRDEGRSALMPYSAGLLYTQPGWFWLTFEFRGYQAVSNDTNTINRAVRQAYLSRADGGSFQYYSINPSESELALKGGLQFGNFGIFAGASGSVRGDSAADTLTVIAGITFSGSINRARPRPEQHFNSRPEKYDEKLFRDTTMPSAPQPTPSPQPPTNNNRSRPNLADEPVEVRRKPTPPPKPRRRPPPQPPAASSGQDSMSVDLMMKQTEKSLNKQK